MSAQTVRHETSCIILFLTWYTTQSMTMKSVIVIHCLHFPLPLFMFCWWHHNRLLMMSQLPDICDATTWQVISNSLDINFIHGIFHSQSCKKPCLLIDLLLQETQMSAYFWCCSGIDCWNIFCLRKRRIKIKIFVPKCCIYWSYWGVQDIYWNSSQVCIFISFVDYRVWFNC